ncbi:DNA damage-regulated autophagy modulator protein 1-like isoform X2 [Mytilus galloprovincialis]|uniref:DNA damage-regulated autophagy modulator protein 1-like isoform X1 n=1 Tax=Mytilus edulis TaxID=6550 RepID=UPI0039EE35C1
MIYYIKPWIYPIILAIEMIFACIIPYLKSTHDGDVKKDFPYISDTGNKGISASAFSLLFNIYGFLAFINITIRFEQIKVNYSYQKSRPRYIVNIITTVVGLISLSGMALVSTFQVGTHEGVHNTGAVLAFGVGVSYLAMQSLFSFFLKDIPGSNIIINIIRIVMSVLQFAFLLGTFIVTIQYKQSNSDLSIKRQAAILEWILAFLVSFYFLTFIPEFRHYDWRIQLDETNIKSNKVDINSDSIYNVGSK